MSELEALAKISEAVSESLYLEESLEAIVNTTMEAVGATGAALVLEDGNIAWPEGRAGQARDPPPAALEATHDRRARLRPRHAVHGAGARAARVDRPPRGGCARARARRHARRPGSGDPPSRQEQPPDRRVAPAAPGALRRRRPAEGARGLGQPDPRDSGGARGADGAPRRGGRPRRAARPAARDARPGAGRGEARRGAARTRLARGGPGDRAGARLQRAAPERARARRRLGSGRARRSATARSCSRSPTTGGGIDEDATGTGLSIVRALVRDELRGTLDLHSNGGLRAEVVFPA